MGIQDYLESLRGKHALLEQMLLDESDRPLPDQAVMARLKREKLRIKGEIARLAEAEQTAEDEGHETGQLVDVPPLRGPIPSPSIEEAVDELERLTAQALRTSREEVEAARRHYREFEKILAEIRLTLHDVDERWCVASTD